MSKPLEPTREQLRAIAEAMYTQLCGPDDVPPAGYETAAEWRAARAWHAIVPIVLEEAAKTCEGLPGRMVLDGPLVAYNCARTIRALKGGGR